MPSFNCNMPLTAGLVPWAGRRNHFNFSWGGYFWLGSGQTAGGWVKNLYRASDPGDVSSWEYMGELPGFASIGKAAIIGDDVYINTTPALFSGINEIYRASDPDLLSWTRIADPPIFCNEVISHKGVLYAYYDGYDGLALVRYVPGSDTWKIVYNGAAPWPAGIGTIESWGGLLWRFYTGASGARPVWASGNGISWSQVIASGAPEGYYLSTDHGLICFNTDTGSSKITVNGSEWLEIDLIGYNNTPFGRKTVRPVLHNGRVWICGGRRNTGLGTAYDSSVISCEYADYDFSDVDLEIDIVRLDSHWGTLVETLDHTEIISPSPGVFVLAPSGNGSLKWQGVDMSGLWYRWDGIYHHVDIGIYYTRKSTGEEIYPKNCTMWARLRKDPNGVPSYYHTHLGGGPDVTLLDSHSNNSWKITPVVEEGITYCDVNNIPMPDNWFSWLRLLTGGQGHLLGTSPPPPDHELWSVYSGAYLESFGFNTLEFPVILGAWIDSDPDPRDRRRRASGYFAGARLAAISGDMRGI